MAAGCIFLSGCAHDPNAGMQSKAAIVVAVDSSVPGQAGRDWQTDQLTSIEKSASDAHYLFDLWSYSGAGARHLWGPTQPLDENQAAPDSDQALAPVSASAPRSPHPGLALLAISREAALDNLAFGRVLILTDGDVSAPNGWNELATGLQPFAARPGWRVEVLGISAQYKPMWQKMLASEMGDRYEMVGEQAATKLLKENTDE
jgi:hypothetical protein